MANLAWWERRTLKVPFHKEDLLEAVLFSPVSGWLADSERCWEMFAFSPLICTNVESYYSNSSDKGLMERGVLIILLLYYNIFDWQHSCKVVLAFDIFPQAPKNDLLKQKGMKPLHLASRQRHIKD